MTQKQENPIATPAPKDRKVRRILRKTSRYALVVLVVAVVAGTFVFLYRKSQPEPVVYELLDAAPATLSRSTVVTGTVEPRDEVLIKPQVSGIIAELYKQAGDPVKQGEVIAKVKVIPDMGSLSAAENRVRLAGINAEQATTDYNRMRQLRDEGLVSAEDYEKARLAYRQALEEQSAAADALQIVREGFSASNATASTTLIRSTIDGLLLDVPVKVGNSVIQSNTFNDGTTIATVADMGDLVFKGSIDETEVANLREGMPMTISVGALPGKTFEARLEYVAPKVSAGTNSANRFEIKAAIRVPDGVTIRAGYSANAEIVLESHEAACTVPEGAVVMENDSSFVYVLTKATPQTFGRRAVSTGMSDGVRVAITQGLKAGQKVRGNLVSPAGEAR